MATDKAAIGYNTFLVLVSRITIRSRVAYNQNIEMGCEVMDKFISQIVIYTNSDDKILAKGKKVDTYYITCY